MVNTDICLSTMWRVICAVTMAVGAEAMMPKLDNLSSRNVYLTLKNIISEGYHAEAHEIITEDGYILEIHRIPYRRNETTADENRPVVMLMHGLLGASNSFTIYGPKYSMGYILADAGYDVWLGNARGSKNSRRHVKLDADNLSEKLQFFDFTFEEIGKYDVAAMVNYILNKTKQERLHYIGHSQGGTTFLVLNSLRPEFNQKFVSAHLLAPVAYHSHFPNMQLLKLARYSDMVYSFSLSLGYVEMYPPNSTVAMDINTTNFCASYPYLQNTCENLGGKLQLTTSDIDADLIGGAAFKQLAHFGQNIRDKLFRRWNYGPTKNFVVYGTENPPLYDLKKITARSTIHYAQHDMLVDERDIVAMANDMPRSELRRVKRSNFLHEEFVTAKDAKDLVTSHIVEAINNAHKLGNSDSYENYYDYDEEEPNSSHKFEPGILFKLVLITLFICSL